MRRVQMELSEETIGRVATLARLMGTDNKTDAVARAIELALMCVEADRDGANILLEYSRYTDRLRLR
jgi:hypothetical protein